MITIDKLDLKKTVDATLTRARSWFFASYPSSTKSNSKIEIVVDYLQDDFKKTPKTVVVSRGKDWIGFGKYTAKDTGMDSYVFDIHSPSGHFTIQETPYWGRMETGNPRLFKELQEDSELSQYISLIETGSKRIKKSQKKTWELDKIMQNSRA